MNIAQAMKTRRRLVARLQQVRKDIATHNCQPVCNPVAVDVSALLAEDQALVEKLVELRAAIATANSPIWPALMHQAEIKAQIEALRGVPTTEGRRPATRFSGEDDTLQYVCQVNKATLDRRIAGLTRDLARLADYVDGFNASTEVDVEVPEELLFGPE